MSLINQMLQDLEQRRAEGGTPAAQVRAVPRREPKNSIFRWVVLLLLAGATLGGGGYWLAGSKSGKTLPSPQTAPAPQTGVPTVVAAPAAEPASPPSVLQLASELSELPAEPAQRGKPITTKTGDAPQTPAAVERIAKAVPEPAKPAPPVAVKGKSAETVATDISKDIKQVSPQQRAENAYRLAYANLQQGRMNEAEESLRQALQHDPRHVAARQALAALLVESKRLDRAEQLLQQGLEQQPGHSGFAMTLARLQVERGDSATALATLQRNPPTGENADYHGFLAALLQRAERHKEAIEQYHAALRVNQNAGPWLLGLGISLQADNQPAKAAEAFRRARQNGNLSPELQAFAEQRLKQLQ